MKTDKNNNLKEKNIKKIKKKVSIITVFLWIFLVATMITIMTENIKNTNAIESENGSVVVKSAFEDAKPLDSLDTIFGDIKLNGKSIEDRGVINVWTNGMWNGPVDAIGYKISGITNSNSNVASIVSPKIDSNVDDKELSIIFEPGNIQGIAEILIDLEVYFVHPSLGRWNIEICLNYTVTNESVYGGETIDPSDLSIQKIPKKDIFKLGEDVDFDITVTNNSNRKISHLKLVDVCKNCEDVILSAPSNINGTVEDFSLEANESITFLAIIEEVQEKHLVDGNKIVNHAYLYIEDGTKVGESTTKTTVEIPIIYSSYKVKHEYYKKNKEGMLILEDIVTNVVNNARIGTKVGISNENERVDVEVNKILEHTIDGKRYVYKYFENSGNVVVEKDIEKEITLKYLREEKISEKVVIRAEKIWEDNNNESLKRPKNVTLQIKNGDEIVEEILVDESNNWSYEFLLQKYEEDGKEIEYTVDEKETSKYYEKRIDGYRVINKYIGEEKNESDNGKIKNEENVNTSDINIVFYVVVFFISIICIIILLRKSNKLFKN